MELLSGQFLSGRCGPNSAHVYQVTGWYVKALRCYRDGEPCTVSFRCQTYSKTPQNVRDKARSCSDFSFLCSFLYCFLPRFVFTVQFIFVSHSLFAAENPNPACPFSLTKRKRIKKREKERELVCVSGEWASIFVLARKDKESNSERKRARPLKTGSVNKE